MMVELITEFNDRIYVNKNLVIYITPSIKGDNTILHLVDDNRLIVKEHIDVVLAKLNS